MATQHEQPQPLFTIGDPPPRSAKDAVRKLLAGDPTLTQEQLVAATGYTERTIRGAVKAVLAEPDALEAIFVGAVAQQL